MKASTLYLTLVSLLLALIAVPLFADQDGKNHRTEPGPNGGRLVVGDDFKLEFFVKADRTVQISFLDKDGAVVSPTKQTVSLIGGDRSNPTRLQFEKSGKVLLSKSALPNNNNMPAILNVIASEGANTIRERFNINMSTCSECSLHEYACICGHEEAAAEHGHSHGPDADHQHK